jgi:DNA-binding LytR/AlgR family response regulator
MIKILIIEDEIPSRKKLKRFLEELETQIEIVAEIDTVTKGVSFLNSNSVDLIFSDIELLDGTSFDIYSQVSIVCPIIFITAYDQFWMNAFESNGIDYLLKPFSKDRFQKAWNKFQLFKNSSNDDSKVLSNLTKIIEQSFTNRTFKKRLSINNHQGIYFLDIEYIVYFEATDGVIFAYDIGAKKHLLNEATLKEIEKIINPLDFFKINRSELVIEKIEYYTKNSLSIKLKGLQKHLITSQNMTSLFRIWLEK